MLRTFIRASLIAIFVVGYAFAEEDCVRIYEISDLNDAVKSLTKLESVLSELKTKPEYYLGDQGERIIVLRVDEKNTSGYEFSSELSKFEFSGNMLRLENPEHELTDSREKKATLRAMRIAASPLLFLTGLYAAGATNMINNPVYVDSLPLVLNSGIGLMLTAASSFFGMIHMHQHSMDSWKRSPSQTEIMDMIQKRSDEFFQQNILEKTSAKLSPQIWIQYGNELPPIFEKSKRFSRTTLTDIIESGFQIRDKNIENSYSFLLSKPVKFQGSESYISKVRNVKLQRLDPTNKDDVSTVQDFFDLKYSTETIATELSRDTTNPVYAVYRANLAKPIALLQLVYDSSSNLTGLRVSISEFEKSSEPAIISDALATLEISQTEIDRFGKELETNKMNSERERKNLLSNAKKLDALTERLNQSR